MTIAPERWERAAREGFTAAADVADVLAVEAGLDYRTAHHVVGRAVRALVDEGLSPGALTPERLSRAAEDAVGRPVEISAEALAAALDPAACAAARRQTGLVRSGPGRGDDRRVPRAHRGGAGAQRGGTGAGGAGAGGSAGARARSGPSMTTSVRIRRA